MEQLMYHVWRYRLFTTRSLMTTDGIPFEVIDPGLRNSDSGPDFFNAKLKFGDTVWAGNLEIHNRSSDWYHHGHHRDESYDNVILNVVSTHDAEVYRTNGDKIRQFVLPLSEELLDDYNYLTTRPEETVPCAFRFRELEPLILSDWKSALATERLLEKANRIKGLVDRYQGNWEEAFYIVLCRSFGTEINSDAFERLARSLPFNYLLKHIDSRLQTEAFLFGQAGFLEEENDHPYYCLLQREYRLLRTKFRLKPLPVTMWRLFRLRPNAFPQVRIACLASLLYRQKRLFSIFMEAESPDALRKLFRVELHAFWENHYQFGQVATEKAKGLGSQTVDSILINTLVPMLFAYGERTCNRMLEERAVAILEQMAAEDNRIVRMWKQTAIGVENAFDSQAVIQLQREYCDRKKCLFCRIGHQLLRCSFISSQ